MLGIGLKISNSSIVQTIALIVATFKTRVLADGGTYEGEANLLSQSLVAINSASFVYVPSAFKSGRMYSLKPTDGSGDLVFSRNSLAYRNNASNVLEQMAANVGRISYVNGVPTLLMEPPRTNLCLQSETINVWAASSANFTKTNTTVLGINASKLFCNTTSNGADYQAGLRYISMPCSLLASTTYTMSFFVEKTSANSVFSMFFAANPSGFDGQYIATFNANSLIATTNGYGASYTNKNAKITHVSGNVFFCETTFTTPASNSSIISISFGLGPQGVNSQIAGNEGSFTGVQIEQGAFSTSRILTTTAAVTRVGDSFSNTDSSNFALTGTLLISYVNNIAVINDGTHVAGFTINNNIQGLYFATTTSGRIRIWTHSAGSVYQTTANSCNLAITYNGSVLNVWENGVKVVTNYSFPFTFNRLQCSSPNVPTFITRIYNFQRILSDSECAVLTT